MGVLKVSKTVFRAASAAFATSVPVVTTQLPPVVPAVSAGISATFQATALSNGLLSVRLSKSLLADLTVTVSITHRTHTSWPDSVVTHVTTMVAGNVLRTFFVKNQVDNFSTDSTFFCTITGVNPNPCGGTAILLNDDFN